MPSQLPSSPLAGGVVNSTSVNDDAVNSTSVSSGGQASIVTFHLADLNSSNGSANGTWVVGPVPCPRGSYCPGGSRTAMPVPCGSSLTTLDIGASTFGQCGE